MPKTAPNSSDASSEIRTVLSEQPPQEEECAMRPCYGEPAVTLRSDSGVLMYLCKEHFEEMNIVGKTAGGLTRVKFEESVDEEDGELEEEGEEDSDVEEPPGSSTRMTEEPKEVPKEVDNEITTLNEKISVEAVYQWSSCLTAEGRPSEWINEYLWPDDISRLRERLKMTLRTLNIVSALQGAGKSSAFRALKFALERHYNADLSDKEFDKKAVSIVAFKWRPPEELAASFEFNPWEGYKETFDQRVADRYLSRLTRVFEDRFADNKQIDSWLKEQKTEWEDPNLNDIIEENQIFVESKVGKSFARQLKTEAYISALCDAGVILIDTPDYSKSDLRLMNRDVDAIQWLWQKVMEHPKSKANFVIFLQKELSDNLRARHFFFGKGDVLQLKPLTPDQLIELYKLKWGDIWPFEEQALRRLARLSRGVPRRFLRYLSLSLESWMIKVPRPELINVALTEEVVTNEEVSKDMRAEITDQFPKSPEMQQKAIRLLTFVLDRPEGLNQKELARVLGLNEMETSRMLDRLESHGYVRREKGEGAEKLVKPNQ